MQLAISKQLAELYNGEHIGLYYLFIIGFIAHTKLQIIGTRVGNKVIVVWLRVYRLSLPIA